MPAGSRSSGRRIVALLTDFGQADPYVGAMKGVILTIAPRAVITDISHEVPPFGVREAAWLLQGVVPWYPRGTIFVCVVDPGVGTRRRAILAETELHRFVAPDNGLLGFLKGARFREISNRRLFLPEVSATFHGRDVFAPVAARLAAGLRPERVGPVLREIVRLPPEPPGRIVWIDRFGNLVTDIPAGPERVRFRGEWLPVVRTYGDAPAGTAVAVVGSRGTVEISVVRGSAREHFGARTGERVRPG